LGSAITISELHNENLASAVTLRAMNSLLERRIEYVALYTAEQNFPSVTLLAKVVSKLCITEVYAQKPVLIEIKNIIETAEKKSQGFLFFPSLTVSSFTRVSMNAATLSWL
jgi:hypothetical protein